MKPLRTVWPPPPKRDNGRCGASTVGDTERLGKLKYSATSTWQVGLSQQQLSAIADHRRARPNDPLPAPLQRDLGRAWLDVAGVR